MLEETAASSAWSAVVVPLLESYLDDAARRLHAACGEVAGCAITLDVDRRPMTLGSSTALALRVDQTQYQIGVGPCLAALQSGVELYVPDLAHDERWEPYGAAAAQLGAASCVSIPVRVSDRTAAVVKVYASEVDGLDEHQRSAARGVASELVGGIALAHQLGAQAGELDDRTAAMDSRRTIDLAIGILMERVGCGADAAFGLLRDQSQRTNVKLREVAAGVVNGRDRPSTGSSAPFSSPGKRTA